MSRIGLKFSQMILHTSTSKMMNNLPFLLVVLHKPTLWPSTFKKIGTTPALIPPGCTSLVQPLDVVYNSAFKQKCADFFHKHIKVSKMEFKIPFILKFSLYIY